MNPLLWVPAKYKLLLESCKVKVRGFVSDRRSGWAIIPN